VPRARQRVAKRRTGREQEPPLEQRRLRDEVVLGLRPRRVADGVAARRVDAQPQVLRVAERGHAHGQREQRGAARADGLAAVGALPPLEAAAAPGEPRVALARAVGRAARLALLARAGPARLAFAPAAVDAGAVRAAATDADGLLAMQPGAAGAARGRRAAR